MEKRNGSVDLEGHLLDVGKRSMRLAYSPEKTAHSRVPTRCRVKTCPFVRAGSVMSRTEVICENMLIGQCVCMFVCVHACVEKW